MTSLLNEALSIALQLSPKERIQLIEHLASSVEREMKTDKQAPTEEHWGKALNRLLDELEPVEFVNPEIEDPVEWVKHQRAEEQKRRLGDWGAEE